MLVQIVALLVHLYVCVSQPLNSTPDGHVTDCSCIGFGAVRKHFRREERLTNCSLVSGRNWWLVGIPVSISPNKAYFAPNLIPDCHNAGRSRYVTSSLLHAVLSSD